MKTSRRNRRGFSFAELMVAVLVLAIGLVPVFWFFSRTNVGTMKTRDEAMAWHYAAELIDVAMAKGYEGIEETGEDGVEVPEIVIGKAKTGVESRFVRRLIVRPLRPDHNSEWPCLYRTVTAEVSWVVEKQPRSMRLTGLLHAPKP